MKKILPFFLMMVLLCAGLPCRAGDLSSVDPILLEKPNPYVFECTKELVLELLVEPVIDYSTGGRKAENYFLFLTVELLYIQDAPWNGLDKNSFLLKHIDSEGVEKIVPLNYMMTAMMSMKNGWRTMADPLEFPTLEKFVLVFDVDSTDWNGWSLIFRPAKRGGDPVCDVEIPLVYRWWK